MKYLKHLTPRSWGLATAGLLVTLILTPFAYALTPIAQSYNTDQKLSLGSIVSLKKNTSDQVVLSSVSSVDSLLGVVIDASSVSISLQNGAGSQAQVATSGTIPTLISDINGDIERGDHITASPVAGVGMKATSNTRIVGIAQGDFKNGVKQKYKDKDGQEHEASFGEVPVLVNIAYYFKEPEKTIIPVALQNVANTMAGKKVDTLPILISIGVFIIMLIIVVSIIYSMIHSSIISVGRNPMSQAAIYRNLIQMSALVLAILGVGLVVIYMVLTRL